MTLPLYAIVAAAILLRRRRQRQKKRKWVRKLLIRRLTNGEHINLFDELLQKEPDFFRCYLCMESTTFETLFQLLKDPLTKKNTRFRLAVPAKERLALTLRYLGHGDSQRLLSITHRIGVSTVNSIIFETLRLITRYLQPIALPTCTIARLQEVERGFNERWNFPNCIGAVDGKHIRIICPPCSGSQFYNYKGYFSIILLAVVDHNYDFLMINVGNNGSQNDSTSFRNSKFGAKLEVGDFLRPEPKPLIANGEKLPHVLLGDEAFPFRDYLMRPYPGRCLSDEKTIFNYRLSRARRVVENAFGILAQKWRIFQRTIQLGPANATRVVKAACLLHNFVRMHEAVKRDNGYSETDLQQSMRDFSADSLSGWRGNVSRSAKDIQAHFAEYFMSEQGTVPWQMRSVHREDSAIFAMEY